ncbi:MAG: hypothetical protein ABSC49_00650 [Candidatus Microgenomates bacterium]|jgi:hypothetical protein
MLGTISAKVTATPGPSGWVQVHEFAPDDPEKMHLRGRLFVVVATKKAGEGIDTITLGRQFVGRLHDEYFGSLTEKPYDSLRNAVQKVVSEFEQPWGKIEIAACAYAGGVVYSAASGGARVVVCRDGSLATILESADEVIAASGYPKEGDLILLGTKAFFDKVSPEMVKSGLISGTLQGAAETFIQIIHETGEEGTAGSVVIGFNGEKNEPVTISQPPVQPQIQETMQSVNYKEKFLDFIGKISRRIPRRSIYIRSGMGDEAISQSRKLTFSAGIILLLILAVSIGFGIRQKNINDLKNKYQEILAEATTDVDQAISLASVNPDQSRTLFLDSEQKLQQIQALKVNDPKVDELQKKINDSRGAIFGEYDVTPDLFLDLGLLSSGFSGDSISSSGGQVFILDKSGSRVVSVALDTKKSKVVAGPTVISSALDLASYETNVYILSSDGIYEVDSGSTKVIDKTWSGDAFLSAFAGNLYVLDKAGNQIYRYSGQVENTFGPQQSWLSASTKADFSGAVSWGMDGAIYVLYPNAKILKYSLGSPQSFSVTGVLPEIGSIDAIYADPDNQYIYLLDRAGKRVVAVDKTGKYKAQYVGDQIAEAKSLVISEAQKEIIFLTGDKLLSIGMPNL